RAPVLPARTASRDAAPRLHDRRGRRHHARRAAARRGVFFTVTSFCNSDKTRRGLTRYVYARKETHMKRVAITLIALFIASSLFAGGKECEMRAKGTPVTLTGTLTHSGSGDEAKTVFHVANTS